MGPFTVAICRQSMRAEVSLTGAPGFGDDHGGRLDRDEGGRRIGPFGFDDGEGAGGAERFDEVGRRLFGDHDDRTLKRHGGRTHGYERRATIDRALLTARQRRRKFSAVLRGWLGAARKGAGDAADWRPRVRKAAAIGSRIGGAAGQALAESARPAGPHGGAGVELGHLGFQRAGAGNDSRRRR